MTKTFPCAGRFDNAPPHLIIISPIYSVAPVTPSEVYRETDDEYEKKKADKEEALILARAEKERIANEKAIERNKKRIEKEEQMRLAREERSQKNRELITPKKPKSKSPILDTRRTAGKPKAVKIKTTCNSNDARQLAPAGYIPIHEVKGISNPGIILAIRSGALKAVKVNRFWFVDKGVADEYVASMAQRRKKCSLDSLKLAHESKRRASSSKRAI